jgi:hypothetical protein
MQDLRCGGFLRPIGAALSMRYLRLARRGCIAGSRRCCWWLKDDRSVMRPGACAPRDLVFAGGSNATWRPMMPPSWRIDRAADDRTWPRGSPRVAWRQPWHATRAAAAIKPRVGRCHCSGGICINAMASQSAPARCAAACMRPTTAGSGLATSMSGGQCICPRKRGINPSLARQPARRRRAAVLRLDVAAAVSSAARGLGPQGHAGHRADHWCERQAGAVRRDQSADRAPGRAYPSACRRC